MASRDDQMIEITPQVLLKAYSCGIFPMAESADDPALYWIEPQHRGILPLENVHFPRRLLKTVRSTLLEVRVDNDYEGVIDGIETTIPLFNDLIKQPDIMNGLYDIHWLEKYLKATETE